MDPRYEQLAQVLVKFSLKIQPNDRALIHFTAAPEEMVLALMRAIHAAGGHPFVRGGWGRIGREFLLHGTAEDFATAAAVELAEMQTMQCYVGLRGSDNVHELADVPMERQNLYNGQMKNVHDWRVNRTRWVVLRWPSAAMAQSAHRSTEDFFDFFFRVCTFDHGRMEPGMRALQRRMARADRVRIVGPGTDISFSIKNIGAIACGGERNIPDGEVFTAPVLDSVEGVISYNVPSHYHGLCFENVRLTFRHGKIVKATASHNGRQLNAILDADEGARRVGEFSLGFHPHITEPIGDILFDEKMAGSLHFTPGQAYENEADNGNRSQIHWDLVLCQRPEFGGGEILFDGEVIRKDGLFLPPDLQPLNPGNLLADHAN
ncbi:MAG: aminopeptidase [Puniceicoccales bacterium]|jgi:aminopeptidase|nr:aminopeptidase [Puniceicoccales bacterium]